MAPFVDRPLQAERATKAATSSYSAGIDDGSDSPGTPARCRRAASRNVLNLSTDGRENQCICGFFGPQLGWGPKVRRSGGGGLEIGGWRLGIGNGDDDSPRRTRRTRRGARDRREEATSEPPRTPRNIQRQGKEGRQGSQERQERREIGDWERQRRFTAETTEKAEKDRRIGDWRLEIWD